MASYKKYSDLDLDFNAHPVTGDVSVLTDADAIRRSLRNLILLNHYEVPFSPHIGSSIKQLLFEPISSTTGFILSKKLKLLIEQYETRVEIQNISVVADNDNSFYNIQIVFNIINQPESIEVGLRLNRIR